MRNLEFIVFSSCSKMSIPPLVCSTPPPLEQCEDDKDGEEFDMQYNLSQYDDDESNDYNYGSFNSFNNMQPTPEELVIEEFPNKPVDDVETTSDDVKSKEIVTDIEDFPAHNQVNIVPDNNIQVNIEEEVIEDLNLKLDHEEPPDIKADLENVEEKYEIGRNVENYTANIPPSPPDNDVNSTTNSCKVEKVNTAGLDKLSQKSDNDVIIDTNEEKLSAEINKDQIKHPHNEEHGDSSVNVNSDIKLGDFDTAPSDIKDKEVLDDDFDDFQFISSNEKPVNNTVEDTIVSQESPWSKEEPHNSDFGTFTANFEDCSSQSQLETLNDKSKSLVDDDDDDFGDFDDFQSSAAEVKNNNFPEELPQQDQVFNFSSFPNNEKQLIENVNKVLTSIFKEEIVESEDVLNENLDSVLNETWGHLMETDVRQPYIVNWNNSLAQKTLLKALCIDSRNILFGPKWSYNMPKYAANLTTAPLQPQKQATTSNTQSETTNPDKGTSKYNTWSDPFETNGQESCSNEGESAIIEPRPTDLDVFEASMSTKKDKIYSSTISVQPIRQINLPDTHIFTPTNSETPRSKTIHYDSSPGPTVLLPQTIMESFKSEENNTVSPPVLAAANNTDADSDYWEFQDFKGPPMVNNSQPPEIRDLNESNAVPKPNLTYQTQLLQPIKLEPIIPTLNWPDPGEIKETFEDFTDFMNNSNLPAKTMTEERDDTLTNEVTSQIASVGISLKEGPSQGNDNFDDDFDTFQSAVPPPAPLKSDTDFKISTVESKIVPNIHHDINSTLQENISEFKSVFLNNITSKSDDISFTNFTKPLEVLPRPIDSTNAKVSSSSGISLSNSSILQPTPTGTAGQVLSPITINQQKSVQILQPLSLESYSHINWPNPGIDLQDLSRFNPVETLPSLKSETSGNSKVGTPIHSQKNLVSSQAADDDIWGEFVSSNSSQTSSLPKKASPLIDDDEWTDFVSSSSVKPQNGLNTISFNVHTNSNNQKSTNQKFAKSNQIPLDIPSLNYITPKTSNHKSYNDKHFQNL